MTMNDRRRDVTLFCIICIAVYFFWLVVMGLVIQSYAADLPDPTLTPGAIDPQLTKDVLCAKGFTTKNYRMTTNATKIAVYHAYGLDGPNAGYCDGPQGCEIDHLISLELGGADVKENLWPQQYDSQPWNAHLKDRLENTLHRAVCAGLIPLDQAQTEIRTDWIAAYKRYIGTPQ